MEVILREHVENLGRRGDVVKVAAGYARNYLLPRKLALIVNEGNRRQIEKEKQVADAREAQEKAAAEAFGARIAAAEVVVARKVGEHDALYGSVTAADIAHALAAQHQIEFDRKKIQLHEPIKALGDFEVTAKVHREVAVAFKVKVIAEGAPAGAAAEPAAPPAASRVGRPARGVQVVPRAARSATLSFDRTNLIDPHGRRRSARAHAAAQPRGGEMRARRDPDPERGVQPGRRARRLPRLLP